MSKNQPINDEHSLCSQCLGFPNSASRKHPVEVFGRCLTRERMQKNKLKKITDTYTGVIKWYISNTELVGTQRNMEKGTVNGMTIFREMTVTS